MGLLSNYIEGRHQLAHSPYVYILVFIAGKFRRHIIGIQQGQVLQMLLLLHFGQLGHQVQHAAGVPFLVADRAINQISFKFFDGLADFLQQRDQDGVSRFHIKDAPAKQVIARFQVPAHLLGQINLFEFFHQDIGLVGVGSQRTIVGNPHRVNMSDHHHRTGTGLFLSTHHGHHALPVPWIIFYRDITQVLRMCLEIGHLGKNAVYFLRHSNLIGSLQYAELTGKISGDFLNPCGAACFIHGDTPFHIASMNSGFIIARVFLTAVLFPAAKGIHFSR